MKYWRSFQRTILLNLHPRIDVEQENRENKYKEIHRETQVLDDSGLMLGLRAQPQHVMPIGPLNSCADRGATPLVAWRWGLRRL